MSFQVPRGQFPGPPGRFPPPGVHPGAGMYGPPAGTPPGGMYPMPGSAMLNMPPHSGAYPGVRPGPVGGPGGPGILPMPPMPPSKTSNVVNQYHYFLYFLFPPLVMLPMHSPSARPVSSQKTNQKFYC